MIPHRLLIVALALIALGPRLRASDPASDERPNILFVFTDDHSTAAISAYGSKINRTPNIDRLAAEGVTFDRMFCTNSICAPSRAVILTGKHSPANGVRDNRDSFDGEQTTFPKLLQQSGYNTAMIGKWHLKSKPTGFDHWEVLPGQGSYYQPDFDSEAGRKRYEGHVTEITTDLALDWLREGRDESKPFLLMCQQKAPHRSWLPSPAHLQDFQGIDILEPATLFDDYAGRSDGARTQEMEIDRHMYMHYDLQVPPADESAELKGPDKWASGNDQRMNDEQRAAWSAAFNEENEAFRAANLEGRDLVRWKYQRYIKNYLRCIADVDDSVGRLLDYLDESGLAENTIVVYSSDQGFFLGEHGWYDKRWMYEPSLRMPFLMRWPDRVEAGSRDTHLAQNIDFAPTFLEAAQVKVPEDMHGSSLLPLLASDSKTAWRDEIYYEYFEIGPHAVEPHRGIRTARHKLMHLHQLNQWEFYDLETDPEEINNLYGSPEHAELIADLEGRLEALRKRYGEPDPLPETPNVVLIYTDDQGYADLGVYGAKGFETPRIDRLAGEGLRFDSFYVSQAVCSASRASIRTGCYPNRIGTLHAFMPWSKIGLADSEETLAELLRERGYRTSFVGKWHLGHQERFLPHNHGYDESYGLPYSNDMWPVDYKGVTVGEDHWKHKYPPLPIFDGARTVGHVETLEDQANLTRLYTERALEFIERQADKGPFFLELAHSMPHVPIGATADFAGRTDYGLYGDVIEEIDASTGEILDALERHGLADNTLVVFTSDNGPWLNYGDHAGSALPLREGKGTMWEGGCRVPCVMRLPGFIPAGSESKSLATTLDLLPTIAELCGARAPKLEIDGVSLARHLRNPGQPGARKEFWYYYGKQLQAVRSGKWKLHFPHDYRTYERLTPGKDGHPGPTKTGRISRALFDLEADPGERRDVADLHPQVVAELEELARRARAELGDRKLAGAGQRESGRVE